MFRTAVPFLRAARKRHYALPAFNTSNLEVSNAIFAASERLKAPLLIAVTESSIAHAGLENTFALVQQLEKNASVPVCIHLDHGKSMPIIKKCLSLGFKSVMVDGSKFPLKKNIAITKKVVSLARRKVCSVEAELGALKRVGSGHLTNPKEARFFVKQTGCDSLAVAIGTSHGAYKFRSNPKIDFERLREIRELVPVPLVLHGASAVPKGLVQKCNRFGAKLGKTSGVPDKDLKKAVKLGITKVNIDTDIRLAFTAGLLEFHAKNRKNFDPRDALYHAQLLTQKIAEQKIRLLGAKCKA